jgi:hypothetical protein
MSEVIDRIAEITAEVELAATQRMNGFDVLDTTRLCPKCRFDSVSTEHQVRVLGVRMYCPPGVMFGVMTIEGRRGVMVRVCAQCRFEWLERPIDYEVVADELVSELAAETA